MPDVGHPSRVLPDSMLSNFVDVTNDHYGNLCLFARLVPNYTAC